MYNQNHKRLSIILTIVFFMVIFLVSSVHAADVTLTWNQPDDSRVTGYNIYCGISGTDYTTTPVQTINSADQTSCLINNLEEGQAYDFTATSLDAEANESDFAISINYLVAVTPSDNDGDGYTVNQGDCNDNDASIHPGAIEICGDGIDQDCNGSDLECTPDPNDVDNDGDGYTENEGDCNDSDATIYPGAIEICGDGIDQDCNGADLVCIENIDNDGDGYTENEGDCNDSDATIYPGSIEICGDGIDQDCNGGDLACLEIEGLTLTWTKPADDRVIGYNLYCGKTGTEFKLTPYMIIDSADTTSYTFTGLEEGFEYSFVATSFDADSNESDFSEVITHIVGSSLSGDDIDDDGDGFTENEGDCNDNDATIYPGAVEICGDGIDQDCNGSDLICPEDIDNDSDGYTENQGDCSDNDSSIHPNAPEICGDGIDQDCNGSDLICPEDIDNDSDGYTENEGDCNDSDSSIHPNAAEICGDGIDQDCNGSDLICPENIDNDGDGYTENEGDCNDSEASINPGATEVCGDGIDQDCNGSDLICPEDIDNDSDGYTENQGDCNDTDSSIHPNAAEICGDGIDQDCNGSDLICPEDIDNDSDGYTENQGDCNDSDSSIHPNAAEICGDGIDQDCNGSDLICPEDIDNDGDGYTENEGDCNDSAASINPGATEVCGDGIDQDCNGSDLICPEDIDNDSDGYTENEGDCNDSDSSIHPNAAEICGDGVDQDCNGSDLICPEDIDNDGDGYTENEGDCDDSDATVFPGAIEICGDGIDQDCNGSDQACIEDIDNDGDGFTENEGDCNDSDATVYPGAVEICGDGIDQDCNGGDLACLEIEGLTLTWTKPEDDRVVGYKIYCGKIGTEFKSTPYVTINSVDTTSYTFTDLESGFEYSFAAISFDADGNESEFSEIINYTVGLSNEYDADNDGDGYTENDGDCNDSDSTIYLGAIEICGDGIDQDCDGIDLECLPDPSDIDDDGDSYTENEGDCNDNDSTIYPGAIEICGDGIDQDCSGSDLICPEDVDNDSDGYTENEGDCNDNDASIHPGAIEICGDGIDQDCDGSDLTCPEDIDNDGDSYTENEGDCNDNDATIYPGAIEICGDGIDQDCDGSDLECIREDIQDIAMETGEVEANHEWVFVAFNGTFTNPVVVAKPASLRDEDPAVVRIRNVNSTGFEVRIQEWDYLDGVHGFETVSYVVMEEGSHVLPNGIMVEAGFFTAKSLASVNFSQSFNQIPVVISGVTTENEVDAVTCRNYDISQGSFNFALQEQEKNKYRHYAYETIAYIAWEPSSGTVNGMDYIVDSTLNEVKQNLYNIPFYPTFKSTPVCVADMQTQNGGDTANVRWQNKNADGIEVQIDEEQSRDSEVNHIYEVVGYMAFKSNMTIY